MHLHCIALGAKNDELQLNVEGDASSALTEGAHFIRIPVRSYADWVAKFQVDEIALMKVNIEGGEYELLEHMINTGLVSKVRNLQVQFHDFVPNSELRMKNLLAALTQTHRPTYQFPFIWENWERLEKPL